MTSALHGYIYLDTALEVHPKSFSSVFLDGVTHLLRCVNPFPVLVQFVHEGATITGDGNLPLATLQCVRKLPMFGVNHLVSVCLFVRPRIVDIRRIAIEQRILVVIEANDFVRGRFSICTRISRIAMCGKSSIAPSQRDTTPDIPARLVFLQFAHLPREAVWARPVRA